MTGTYKINYNYWQKNYYSPNVESFIFRLHSKLLSKYLIKKKLIRILDFGCGQGSNLHYFYKTFDFIPYGVDISKKAIETCKKKIFKYKNNFKLIDPIPSSNNFFFKNLKFDIIIASQSLYYLDNSNLETVLRNFNLQLKDNGLVFFTMVSKKSFFWKYSSRKNVNKNGMTRVKLRKNTFNYFNFVNSKKDLTKKFKIFKPLNIGYYDLSLTSTKISRHHYIFFGKKFI
jgi:SAM-dependent methyltransferase